MRGIAASVALVALLAALSGCMGRKTVVIREDPRFNELAVASPVLVRECRSSKMRIRILLMPPIRSPEEIWTRPEIRIEMAVYAMEQYGIFSPLHVVWDHVLNGTDSRTFFDDLPTLEKGTSVTDGKVEFSKKYYVDSMRRFLLQIRVSQPVTQEALTEILSNYAFLIDSCVLS